MAMADGFGLPLAIHIESAAPHEVALVEPTLAACFVDEQPERLIGDKAYDRDPVDEQLVDEGIEMIVLHRPNERYPRPRMVGRYDGTSAAGRSSGSSRGYELPPCHRPLRVPS